MAMTSIDYRDQLLSLLPRGRAWTRSLFSMMAALMHAIGDEFSRVEQRADDLQEESDPRTTVEMIDDWERALGLPDACSNTIAPTLEERRAAVVGKYLGVGGHNIPYLISVASRMGFEVSIIDKITPYHYEIVVPGVEAQRLSVGVGAGHQVGSPLRSYGNEQALECAFMRLNQAHTVPTFTYGAAADYSITYNYEVQRHA